MTNEHQKPVDSNYTINSQIEQRNNILKKIIFEKYGERGLELAIDILRYAPEIDTTEFWRRFDAHI